MVERGILVYIHVERGVFQDRVCYTTVVTIPPFQP